jgi:hypothetical protein
MTFLTLCIKGLVLLLFSRFSILGENNRRIMASTRRTALHVHASPPWPRVLPRKLSHPHHHLNIIITIASQSHKDIFFDVLLESLVTRTITMEHEYASLLFSVDGLRHPLLRNIDFPKGANGDYIITYHSFSQTRIQILSSQLHKPSYLRNISALTFIHLGVAIFTNLSTNLQNEQHTPDLRSANQISLGHIVKMLVAMQDIYQVNKFALGGITSCSPNFICETEPPIIPNPTPNTRIPNIPLDNHKDANESAPITVQSRAA